ncbi:putative FAD-dependent pyridine nucleotide-disulfide oxidoreductase [Desulfosarcina variabilis str. Montpellier]|uniref:NAD(P)/FAD-dependent oxidoreductase n=1 Tax=Desulfosarcina variabilis TaxID=2300 RepID=UPI003AFA0253
MTVNRKYDVIVVGAGPGGSLASLLCAQAGFKTLMIEKKRLPRDKVCSGMVMGAWAKNLIEEHFGTIPEEILTQPKYLSGNMFHVPGMQPKSLEWHTPIAWRLDLDSWLTEKAVAEDVDVWDRTRLVSVLNTNGKVNLSIDRGNASVELECSHMIGADGAASRTRKCLFPKLSVKYTTPLRECYRGALDLKKDYIHWFFPKLQPRPRFNVNHKGEVFLIEGSGIKELRPEINTILAQYGFDPNKKPVWRDGCVEPVLHEALISGSFVPVKGNVLLVGDAAGLILPITFEGIGTALKSGKMAAEAIKAVSNKKKETADQYLEKIQPIVQAIGHLVHVNKKAEKEAAGNKEKILDALVRAYEETLKLQQP